MPLANNLLSIYVLINSLLALLVVFLLFNVSPFSEINSVKRPCWRINYAVPFCFQTYPAYSAEPRYSLSRAYPYEYKITTQKGVNYYVKSKNFERKYPVNSPVRLKVEGRVEREYISILSQNCRFEAHRQQWGFIRETPHCDLLRKFEFGFN